MKKQRQAGFLIAKIHHLAGRIFAGKLKQYNIELNPAQGRIMFVLWRQEGIPIHELARKTSLAKSTLTSMLDRLEADGHIIRRPSADDRRKILVQRTSKDYDWEKRYQRVSREMTELFLGGFSALERDRFEEYLQRVLENLQADKEK